MNVRFGDGYVEKVKAFVKQKEIPNEGIIKIDLFKKSDGQVRNLVHTVNGVYEVDDEKVSDNLITDSGYKVSGFGHISSVNAFDEYIYTAYGIPIYYCTSERKTEHQEGQEEQSPRLELRRLEGTYNPEPWVKNHDYNEGDVVRPTKYNGYVYKCTQTGKSGTTEVNWVKDLSTPISDNTTKWVGIGSLVLEGTGVTDLTARCVEMYKGFLFVANTQEGEKEYPYRVRWSQWQNPRMWHNNEDGSGMSNYVDVDDTEGKIVAMKTLGDALYVYKERSIISFTFTGGEDTVFSKEVVTTKTGLISPEAIVEFSHMHLFVGHNDIYAFDGNTCVPIGDEVSHWFFDNLKPEDIDKIRGYYNEESQDAVFVFSNTTNTGDNLNRALTYNTKQRTWSVREMYITAVGEYRQTKDRVIDETSTVMDEDNAEIDSALFKKDKHLTMVGDENGNLYLLKGDEDTRLDKFEGYVITKTHHMDSPDRIKRLLRIQFHIETVPTDYNLYCQVGWGWNAETPMHWEERQYMNLKEPNPWYNHHIAPFVDVDLSARYFQIRFGTENNKEPFRILGYTLFYQLRSDE